MVYLPHDSPPDNLSERYLTLCILACQTIILQLDTISGAPDTSSTPPRITLPICPTCVAGTPLVNDDRVRNEIYSSQAFYKQQLKAINMNNIVRFSPSREVSRMQHEIDRIFNDFFPGRPIAKNQFRANSGDQATWIPRVDLSESDEGYTITFDLPGLSKKDIDINYRDGVLTVSGERIAADKQEGENFLRVERRNGKFSRAFNIPNAIQTDKISANYKDGVLSISLLKAEEVKPVKVKVS